MQVTVTRVGCLKFKRDEKHVSSGVMWWSLVELDAVRKCVQNRTSRSNICAMLHSGFRKEKHFCVTKGLLIDISIWPFISVHYSKRKQMLVFTISFHFIGWLTTETTSLFGWTTTVGHYRRIGSFWHWTATFHTPVLFLHITLGKYSGYNAISDKRIYCMCLY